MRGHLTRALAALLLVAGYGAAPAADDVLLLFTDRSLFTSFDNQSLRLEMHRPEKGALVIWPTEPWETGGNSCYDHVLQISPGVNRMYYDCIETCLHSNCTIYGATQRRICLATSVDGLT